MSTKVKPIKKDTDEFPPRFKVTHEIYTKGQPPEVNTCQGDYEIESGEDSVRLGISFIHQHVELQLDAQTAKEIAYSLLLHATYLE